MSTRHDLDVRAAFNDSTIGRYELGVVQIRQDVSDHDFRALFELLPPMPPDLVHLLLQLVLPSYQEVRWA